jgi:hypothetical protein
VRPEELCQKNPVQVFGEDKMETMCALWNKATNHFPFYKTNFEKGNISIICISMVINIRYHVD